MKKSLSIFAIYVALTATASAQESAESVQTSGSGQLRIASGVMISPGGQNISISLPATVSKGDVISIQYQSSGGTVSDSFMVTGISIRNGSCALENKRNTAPGKELSDMIYTGPCKKLQ